MLSAPGPTGDQVCFVCTEKALWLSEPGEVQAVHGPYNMKVAELLPIILQVLEEAVTTAARWGLVAPHQHVVVLERVHEHFCVKVSVLFCL